MAEIKLVITIPEDIYEKIQKRKVNQYDIDDICQSVFEGTPLPKGHGRLIDADKMALLSDLFCYTKYTGIDEAPYEDATKALAFAPTIIEADEVESEVQGCR